MASSEASRDAKMFHVNLMQDTVIANLPERGLRSVLRSMLATDPSVTKLFEDRTRVYLRKTSSNVPKNLFVLEGDRSAPTELFRNTQQRIRSMLGCGMVFESILLLTDLVLQANAALDQHGLSREANGVLSTVDGDIIQALTAIQKTLYTTSGSRPLNPVEREKLVPLYYSLRHSDDAIFERSLTAVHSLLGLESDGSGRTQSTIKRLDLPTFSGSIEAFQLGSKTLPRLFSGLWQLSSPLWGAGSSSAMREQFITNAAHGFTAYDMADHYGDAEVIFGSFRASCSDPSALFGATKYCVFTPTTITPDVVRANVAERCWRMSSDHIDLLQFHWQFYDDPQYLDALRYLQEDERVHQLGLCNFDTQRMGEVLNAGIKIATNQVQFSLIDSRPMFKMADVCTSHEIRLLTYGTLCGGFIAEKWLGQPEPELFSSDITPSQRKYYEMIVNWGGWDLFQELLQVLKYIALKRNVSISNVATRWVLDFPYVGAVLVGTRLGASGHAEENLKAYGWRLDEQDQEAINRVLAESRRNELITMLGDCGGEYR